MRRPLLQILRKRDHDMRSAAAHTEVEHRPVVPVPEHFAIGAERFVIPAFAVPEHRILIVPPPIEQIGRPRHAHLFNTSVRGIVEIEEPVLVLHEPGLINAVLFPGSAVCVLHRKDRLILCRMP